MTETFTAYEFGGNWFIGSSKDDSRPIAVMIGHENPAERARLMAAASELLAACKAYIEWAAPVLEGSPDLRPIREAIRAAIAKAE